MRARLVRYFTEYEEAHRHPVCRLTHIIAIPQIFLMTYTMLDWIDLWTIPGAGGLELSFGHLWYLAMLAWYTTLTPKYAAIMTLVGIGVFALSPHIPWPVVVAVYCVAWVIQVSGHLVWEKNKPAFFSDYAQMYIGPVFFLAKLFRDWPLAETPGKDSPAGDEE